MHGITKKWFVVYTRPRWEKKVAGLFAKKKIEHYCPLNKVHKQWSDRKKTVEEPLFTSYVFVRIDEAEQLSVRLTDGVVNFIYWLGKPAVIHNDEIETIKDFLTNHQNISLQKTNVNLHDNVRIVEGPLVSQVGKVVSIKNKTVKILLPSLGYLMQAEVNVNNLEILSTEMPGYAASKQQQKKYSFS
ncbi:MAG: UpxY family transcription antiterminator [Chitinophagaceae bacterium]